LDRNIGRKLDGRYDIQEIIGVGGMAVVYKAYDSIDDRTVAVKILKEEFSSNEEFLRRFKNESKAIAVLFHPNIVKVFDVSFSEKLQYIVMEYIDGITLKEYIEQQGALLWKEAVHFTVQILRALQHAHNKGIVHRDIKPQNIMLLQDGTIKVTDFGIAHFTNSETQTMTDKAIGSVHYISPEQARGEGTDNKADIYSVGVMLFEMLTGKLPFEADSAVSVAIMQMQTEPRHPREINDTIPEGLEDITLRAMQKDPSKRYESAADMLRDIDEFKNNPSIHFAYKYFIDDSPTKYVDVIKNIKGEDDNTDLTKKKKATPLMPVLSGVAAAVLLVFLIGVIVVMGMFGFGPFSNSNGQVQVPDLVGQKIIDVRANTLYKDFKITEDTKFSDTVPEGTIMSQAPDKTIKIKSNGAITVVVSKGPLKANVPDTYGQNLAQAQNILDNAGFKSKSVNQYDPTTIIGMVISTDPQRDNSVPQSTVVTIYISQGPPPTIVPVPDLTNLSLTAAKSLLESKGLKIGTPTYQANALPKDTVLSQTPAANTPVSGGQAIQVVCSYGSLEANFDVNLPSGNYTIRLQIDGKYIDKYTYTSAGGVKSTITIPAGNFTNAHDVSIIVNDKPYQSFNYDFTLVQTVQMYEDNSDNGTDFNLISSVPSRPSSTSSTVSAKTTSSGSSKTTYGGSSYTTSVKKK
jgi:beta-lactam-binding protein with PASTA domain